MKFNDFFGLNYNFRFSFYGLSDWTLQSFKLATLLERETTKTKSFIALKQEKIFGSILLNLKRKRLKFVKNFFWIYTKLAKRVKTVEKKIIKGSVIADNWGAHSKKSKTNENI